MAIPSPSLKTGILRSKWNSLPPLTVEHVLISGYHLWSISEALFYFHHGLYVIARLWTQLPVIVIYISCKIYLVFSNNYRARRRDSFTLYAEKTFFQIHLQLLWGQKHKAEFSFPDQKKKKPNPNSSRGETCQSWYCYCAGKATENWAKWTNYLKATEYSNPKARVYTMQLVAVCPAQTLSVLVMLQGCQ